jgi:hypothetical protein
MQTRGFGTSIGDGDFNQDVVRRVLGILNGYIEVAVLIKNAGVLPAPCPLTLKELPISGFLQALLFGTHEAGSSGM